MQQSSSHIGNARREERVPLAALIELRSEHGDEALSADGIDVSASGIAVRAAFVPEAGTRLYCDFRCPPDDDAVHAVGEVVWAAWDGPRSGSFGLRFLELDTKSATTIRRYVAPEALVEPPPPPRVANMRIDGVPSPIEADVRLLEKDCIVLEQELSFLRLGRGIEVDVPGRGKERGRIASIELRQGPLDTPTLVFGVLLDEKPQLQPELARSGRGQIAGADPRAPAAAEDAVVEARDHARARGTNELLDPAAADGVELPAVESVRPAARAASAREQPQVVRVAASERREAEDAAEEAALANRTPPLVVWLKQALALIVRWTQLTLWPWLRARMAPKPVETVAEGESEAETSAASVPLAQRLLLPLVRVRAALGVQWTKLQKQRAGKRRTTAPTPRMQRSQPVRAQRADAPAPTSSPRNRRLLTVSLALVGVGLGVYALAPRSGADRIRVRTRTAESPLEPSSTLAPALESVPGLAPAAARPEPAALTSASSQQSNPAAPLPVVTSLAVDGEPAESVGSARFGESSVPNGRTFVLRMSGPVRGLEGDKREDGFSVRIPGRLALDRASPIATSHRAVARALILNRGEYAELTVDFLPGMRPKYQVVGKDNTLEVTLERL